METMELSDMEKKLVERLQSGSSVLVRWRWLLLISAVIYFGHRMFRPDIHIPFLQ